MPVKVSLEELIKTGAHFGHQTKRWNPKMESYIHGSREGVHIIDITITKELLEDALKRISEVSNKGGGILLVGTKKQVKDKVEMVAKEAGVYWVKERWLGGTLTNFDQIKKSIKKLSDMKKKLETGEYKKRTKKERLLIRREIDRLERFFGGIAEMVEVPEIIFIIDIKREIGAVKEAKMKKVDVIAVVDTNCDPTIVDYPIPMNDDASKALEYILELVRDAILDGKKKKSKVKVSVTKSKNAKKTTKTKVSSKKK